MSSMPIGLVPLALGLLLLVLVSLVPLAVGFLPLVLVGLMPRLLACCLRAFSFPRTLQEPNDAFLFLTFEEIFG
ncbi:hypothetical protein Taro_030445 [Colocasia esculenta]|uniref:Uncharacterized protein n=1 Tax=Colocasia esculenta TaxID=4460 RepID=A0A843VXX4_COLES|nr:hypothetical protein [Colocasia esculenta]